MKRYLLFSLLIVIPVGWLLQRASRPQHIGTREKTAQVERPESSTSVASRPAERDTFTPMVQASDVAEQANASSWAKYTSFFSSDFTQHFWIASEYEFDGSPNELVVEFIERDPALADFHYRYEMRFASSFRLQNVFERCANDFIVLGVYDDGEQVIERWTIMMPRGAWDAKRYQSSLPLGASEMPSRRPAQATLVGGVFLPPSDRTSFPAMRRSIVLKSQAAGPIACAAIDPDGRFIAFSSGVDGVKIVPIGGGPSQLIAGTETFHLGVHRIRFLGFLEHTIDGRTLLVQTGGGYSFNGICNDANNDGVFESVYVLSNDELDSSPGDYLLSYYF